MPDENQLERLEKIRQSLGVTKEEMKALLVSFTLFADSAARVFEELRKAMEARLKEHPELQEADNIESDISS